MEENRSSNEELQTLLAGFSMLQLRFLVARLECNTNVEAAEAIGIKAPTVSTWGEPIKRALELMRYDGIITALEIQRRALPEAMAVKVAGLKSENEKIRQDAATEIIDRNIGKPVQRSEVTGKDGGSIAVEVFDSALMRAYGETPNDGSDST